MMAGDEVKNAIWSKLEEVRTILIKIEGMEKAQAYLEGYKDALEFVYEELARKENKTGDKGDS